MRAPLVRFLAARLGDPSQAEDVYQEMFARLKAADLSQPIHNESAFLFRIAANLASDLRRGGRRREQRDGMWLDATTHRIGADAVAEAADPESAIDAKRRLAAVAAAVADLPPKCREVFVLHKLEGHSHAEVADRMGISRKMVEKHMSNALRALAVVLQNQHGGRNES
ncbi:MAG: sigma-70 family RNA polymerase sigma factor [Rhodobacteraceae bacterium]|nr:sigma-70 family RNA polymerase sigma factor [Paracoccaceae bacterium]